MTSTLQLWARYNQAVDLKVNSLLTSLGEDGYRQPRTTHFKSLAGLHLHILETYRFYQGLVRANTQGRYFVSSLTAEGFEVKPASLAETVQLYEAYDALLLEFAGTVTEADLAGPKFKRTQRSGKTYLVSVGDMMTQYMNHTTHHRGQLSQLMDELGLEHDIGGLVAYTEEVTG